MRDRIEKIKEMKRALRIKREDGVVEEVNRDEEPTNEEDKNEDMEVENHGEEEEWEDDVEDEYEEEEAEQNEWVSDGEADEEQVTEVSEQKPIKQKEKKEVFLGNNKKLGQGEYLEFQNKAYDMLHRMTTEWPCLSIDVITGGDPFSNLKQEFCSMNKYPYEIYTVQGTQAESGNQIYIARWSKLHKTKYDDDSQDCEDEEDDDLMNDEQPEVDIAYIDTKFPINRLRTLNYTPIVACWNENAQVIIMDLSKKYRSLKEHLKSNPKEKVEQKAYKSSAEGFALNWNPRKVGQLASGNMNAQVVIYEPQSVTDWTIGQKYHYHKGSVEDIQFSPSEEYAFASCSSDGTVQVVDMRVGDTRKSQLLIKAHSKDVNVLDWNSKAAHLIVTGSDDCSVKVWDLRMAKQFQGNNHEELISFNWHEEPITSVCFQPNEQSVLAVASQDNRVTIWDLAVENEKEEGDFPNELMFIHQGQEEIKEIRYHPIYYEMIVSTASNGINAFKPSFAGEDEEEDDEADLKKPPIREDELEDYLARLSLK